MNTKSHYSHIMFWTGAALGCSAFRWNSSAALVKKCSLQIPHLYLGGKASGCSSCICFSCTRCPPNTALHLSQGYAGLVKSLCSSAACLSNAPLLSQVKLQRVHSTLAGFCSTFSRVGEVLVSTPRFRSMGYTSVNVLKTSTCACLMWKYPPYFVFRTFMQIKHWCWHLSCTKNRCLIK